MGTGYVRNDTSNNIADGNIIDAADLDGEFDAIESAFGVSGHTHDGSASEGGVVTVVGPAQDFVASASGFEPKADSTYELGSTALRWSTGYLDDLELTNALPIAQGGTGQSTAETARNALGLAIGVNVQAYTEVLNATDQVYNTAEKAKVDGALQTTGGTLTGALIAPSMVLQSDNPSSTFIEDDAALNEKRWDQIPATGAMLFRTRTDANGAGVTWMTVSRSGTSLTDVGMSLGATPIDSNSLINVRRGDARYLSKFGAGLIALANGVPLTLNRTGTDGTIMDFQKSGTSEGSISITTSATSYNTTSDERTKENITPISNALDILKVMRPCNYTAISDGVWYDGFLAHELQEVLPFAVKGTRGEMQDEVTVIEPEVLDEEGTLVAPAITETTSVPKMMSVDYAKLTPILTAALKEALVKIENLEERLGALEALK